MWSRPCQSSVKQPWRPNFEPSPNRRFVVWWPRRRRERRPTMNQRLRPATRWCFERGRGRTKVLPLVATRPRPAEAGDDRTSASLPAKQRVRVGRLAGQVPSRGFTRAFARDGHPPSSLPIIARPQFAAEAALKYSLRSRLGRCLLKRATIGGGPVYRREAEPRVYPRRERNAPVAAK
jgi:hypothetical protein